MTSIARPSAAEEDRRNEWGMPSSVGITAHERSNQTTHVDQSVNKALPWVAFSWFLSGGSIVGLVLIALLIPSLIDSKVDSGVSEARANAAQELATAKADMDAANTNARLALDKMQRATAQLEAKGLIKQETH